ncbi:MAG: zinc-binding dehydrogenase [Candidatus Omnitrophica bacterium]|nr:zinc-binding dehydrogenase [Candidatus Omnitrophota bacterium]
MKTRAAILWQLHKPLVIDDVEIPKLKKGQVLVKVLYSGICRAQYNEMIGLKGPDKFLPHLLGHEASGLIVDTGPGITKVKKGDYVCLSWIKGRGLDAFNSQYALNGHMINAGAVTTFSDYTVVSENRVTKIPKSMPADAAAILGCAIVTGCGIMENTVAAQPGTSVAVFGVGGIGLSVILGARRRGCSRIIAVDIDDKKLRFAKRLGATHVLNASHKSTLGQIAKIAPRGFDYAVDASGNKSAMENAFTVIREKGGTCVIAGNLSRDERISLHPFDLIKGKRIIGTWGGETLPDRDIPKYVRAFARGNLPFDRMITHRFDLEDINKAFNVLVNGEAGRIIVKAKHGQ